MTNEERPRFSKRFGYASTSQPITVREDAPSDLRYAVAELGRTNGMPPHQQRSILCRLLLTRPDPNNWSAYPNVWEEVLDLLDSCAWYQVYNAIEEYYEHLKQRSPFDDAADNFESDINDFVLDRGIGWQMESGEVVFRGSEAFSAVTTEAAAELFRHSRE